MKKHRVDDSNVTYCMLDANEIETLAPFDPARMLTIILENAAGEFVEEYKQLGTTAHVAASVAAFQRAHTARDLAAHLARHPEHRAVFAFRVAANRDPLVHAARINRHLAQQERRP